MLFQPTDFFYVGHGYIYTRVRKVKLSLSIPWRYMRDRCISPLILTFGIRWQWVVKFVPELLYPRKKPWYLLSRRLGGPQSPSWSARAEKNLIHTEIANKMQQCIRSYYSMFIWSSTCFGRHTAHHQELKTALAASGFAYVKGCWTLRLLDAVSVQQLQLPTTFHVCKTRCC